MIMQTGGTAMTEVQYDHLLRVLANYFAITWVMILILWLLLWLALIIRTEK
jgi:hypothetical protein